MDDLTFDINTFFNEHASFDAAHRAFFARDAEFKAHEHPRGGNPDNPGEFSSAGGGGEEPMGMQPLDRQNLPAHLAKYRIPPAWTDVQYNTDPQADLLVVGRDTKGRRVSLYSSTHTAQAAATKFARIDELLKKFNTIQRQNDQAKTDPAKREAAEALDLVMKMGLRPGSERDTGAAKQAYGATTLQGRHVKVRDTGYVALNFTGKKGVQINLPVRDPALVRSLTDRKAKAGDSGKLFNISDAALRDYVDSLDGGGFHTKDFRTCVAAKTAMGEIAKIKRVPQTQTAFKKAVREIAKIVAAKLGNTPTVALQSYIPPEVFTPWRANLPQLGADQIPEDWPDARWGDPERPLPDWRRSTRPHDPDDEELAQTPEEVIAVLGFDPLEEDDSEELQGVDDGVNKFFGRDLEYAIDEFFAFDDIDWKEEEHPRDKGGKFTSGAPGEPAAIPDPPQIKSTQPANLGKQKHLNALHKHAQAGEWDKVEAYPTPGVNTYAKMVQKYKASLLALKDGAPTAPVKPAPKKEKLSEIGKSIPDQMQMYDDMLLKDFSGIEKAEALSYEQLYNDKETGYTISIHKPEYAGGNLQWEIGNVTGSSIADFNKALTKLKAEQPPKPEPKKAKPEEPTPTAPTAKEPGKIVTPAYHETMTSKGFTVGHISKLTGATEYTAPDGGVVTLLPPAKGDTLLRWEYTKPDGETEEGKGHITLSSAISGYADVTPKPTVTAPEPKPTEPAKPKGAAPINVPLDWHDKLSEAGFEVFQSAESHTVYTKPGEADGPSVLIKKPPPGAVLPQWEYVGPSGQIETGIELAGLVEATKPPPPAPPGFSPSTTPASFVKTSYSEPMANKGFKVTHKKTDDDSTIYTHPSGAKVIFNPPEAGHTTLPWTFTDAKGAEKKGKGSSELTSALTAITAPPTKPTPTPGISPTKIAKKLPRQMLSGKTLYEDAFGNELISKVECDTNDIPKDLYKSVSEAFGNNPNNGYTPAVTHAMQEAGNYYKSQMTQASQSAVSDYKGSGYGSVNAYLRGAQKSPSPGVVAKVNAIRKAMDLSFIPARMPLWRGIPASFKEVTGFDDPGDAVGRAFVHRNFGSFSRSQSFAESWAHYTGTVIHCTFPPGSHGIPVGNQDYEYETLIPDHTVFLIDKVEKKGNQTHLFCTWRGVTTMEETTKGVTAI